MANDDAAFIAIRAALLASYAGSLASSRMSPMEALECAAAALGSIYREVADAHLDPNGCQCGWLPAEMLDILALQQALAAHAAWDDDATDAFDLRAVLPVGHG